MKHCYTINMLVAVFCNSAKAWNAGPLLRRTRQFHSTCALFEGRSSTSVDEYGRRIRRRLDDNRGNDEEHDDWNVVPYDENDDFPPHHQSNTDGWDDFDPFTTRTSPKPRASSSLPQPSRMPKRSIREGYRSDRTFGSNRDRYDSRSSRGNRGGGNKPRYGRQQKSEDPERKINMKALEGAGFVHLYGLASVLNALKANRRDFTRPEDHIDLESLQGEEYEHEKQQRERKPAAQFSPWLFLQEQKSEGKRQTSKASQAEQVKEYAKLRGIPAAYVDKGELNTLSGNRPHGGCVLRCGKLFFEPMARLPHPDELDESSPRLWLALDEVVDPANFGALLRSAFFLGGFEEEDKNQVGVLICSKNSAPPSPVVSATSAGALELMEIYSTNNLPRALAQAESDGYRVIGASSSVPRNVETTTLYDLQDLPSLDRKQPTILVLGSEGYGLRNLVATTCTEFVRIPGGRTSGTEEDEHGGGGVDSLNVSVTGGILLWHLLRG